MSDIEGKLKAVDLRFRQGSGGWHAARYIVQSNREIDSEERKVICQEIPIKDKTLQGVFTKLRKLNLYPPQKTLDIPEPVTIPETLPEISNNTPENPNPPLQKYATIENLNELHNALSKDIHYLATVISGEAPSNPVESIEAKENEVSTPEEIEINIPEDMPIKDPSLNRHGVWLKPKTQMYFDLARQGIFSNYVDSRELGPFTQFTGNLSDFFNMIVDDYFIRLYNADIGLLMRRYVK